LFEQALDHGLKQKRLSAAPWPGQGSDLAPDLRKTVGPGQNARLLCLLSIKYKPLEYFFEIHFYLLCRVIISIKLPSMQGKNYLKANDDWLLALVAKSVFRKPNLRTAFLRAKSSF
jgi:hypothetical protein